MDLDLKRLVDPGEWVQPDAVTSARTRLHRRVSYNNGVASFEDAMSFNLGRFLPPTAWVKQRRAYERLQAHSDSVCDKLEAEGIQARVESNLVSIDLVHCTSEPVVSYRQICLIPSVAQKKRRSQLDDLEYYLTNIDGDYWRYLVITFGQRIPAFGELKKAMKKAKRQLAKWRERICKVYGVEVGFQGFEFPRKADGTYHLHANVLIKTPRFSDKGEGFRRATREHFKAWVKDNGKIENTRELVKYPFKPSSIEEADSAEVAWLHRETYRQRITQLLGPISEFRQWRESSRLRVFRMGSRLRLREVANIMPPADEEDIDQEEDSLPAGGSGENILVAKVLPNFARGMWASPSVLVMNYNPNPREDNRKAVRRLETLHEWMADALHDWEQTGAPEPAVVREMAAAALQDEGDTNVRALWDRKASAEGASYIVHNVSLSSPKKDTACEFASGDPPDTPEKEPDDTAKVIPFPAKNIETEKTTEVVEEDVCLAESYGGILEAIFGCDDAGV